MFFTLFLSSVLGWLAQARIRSQKAWDGIAAIKHNVTTYSLFDRQSASASWQRALGIDVPKGIETFECVLNKRDEKVQAYVLAKLSQFPQIKKVAITNSMNSPMALGPLTRLPNLEELALRNGKDIEDAGKPCCLPSLPKLKRFSNDSWSKEHGLDCLTAMPSLEEIELLVFYLDHADLLDLHQLKHLRRLHVACPVATDSKATAEAFAKIATLQNLEELQLDWETLLPDELRPLAQLKKLKRFELICMNIDDAGLAPLAKMSSLDELLVHTHSFTGKGLESLSQLKSLKRLSLTAVQNDDSALVDLGKLASLEKLEVHCPTLSHDELEAIAQLKQLKRLALPEKTITSEGLALLTSLSTLENLSIEGPFAEIGLKPLIQLKRLTQLNLNGSKLTDTELKTLEEIPSLEQLAIDWTFVTATGIAKLKKANPKLVIVKPPEERSLDFLSGGR